VTFGNDLALCALAYDLCFEWWTDAEPDFLEKRAKTCILQGFRQIM
jgi:hypothetical protein